MGSRLDDEDHLRQLNSKFWELDSPYTKWRRIFSTLFYGSTRKYRKNLKCLLSHVLIASWRQLLKKSMKMIQTVEGNYFRHITTNCKYQVLQLVIGCRAEERVHLFFLIGQIRYSEQPLIELNRQLWSATFWNGNKKKRKSYIFHFRQQF